MLDRVFTTSLAEGATEQSVIMGRDLNGLIVTKDSSWKLDDKIEVSLRSDKHESKVLVPNLSLADLADVSNLEFGQSRTAMDWTQTQTEQPGYTTVRALRIPLGQIKMKANKSVIEVTVRAGTGGGNFDVTSYIDNSGTDQILTLNETFQSVSTHADVEGIYILSDVEMSNFSAKDIQVQVEGNGRSHLVGFAGSMGFNLSSKRIEVEGPGRVLKVYEHDGGGVPGDIKVQLSGADTGDFRVLVRQFWLNGERILRGAMNDADALQAAINSKDMGQIAALVASGAIPEPTALAKVQAAVRAGNLNLSDAAGLASAMRG